MAIKSKLPTVPKTMTVEGPPLPLKQEGARIDVSDNKGTKEASAPAPKPVESAGYSAKPKEGPSMHCGGTERREGSLLSVSDARKDVKI